MDENVIVTTFSEDSRAYEALARLKALAAVVAPGLAGRLVRRRDQRVWLGAGETTVEHV